MTEQMRIKHHGSDTHRQSGFLTELWITDTGLLSELWITDTHSGSVDSERTHADQTPWIRHTQTKRITDRTVDH